MAIRGIGDGITLSIEALSLTLTRGEELLVYYRYAVPEQVATVGRTIFGTATIQGSARLVATPKQAFVATLLLDEDQMRVHEAIYKRQQELTALRVNPGITLDDRYQFEQDVGSPKHGVVPGQATDTTSAPGFVRYFPRFSVFYNPLPDDRFALVRGKRGNKIYYQFEVRGVEL